MIKALPSEDFTIDIYVIGELWVELIRTREVAAIRADCEGTRKGREIGPARTVCSACNINATNDVDVISRRSRSCSSDEDGVVGKRHGSDLGAGEVGGNVDGKHGRSHSKAEGAHSIGRAPGIGCGVRDEKARHRAC